jgi:tight adherence protein C
MNPVVIIAIAAALFIGGSAWLIYMLISGGDSKAAKRLERMARRGDAEPSALHTGGEFVDRLLAGAGEKFAEQLMPKKEEEVVTLKQRLHHAGIRGEGAVAKFLASRVIFLVVGAVISVSTYLPLYGTTQDFVLYSLATVGICFYLPNVYLLLRIKSRQESIFFGLPDALDLMVVCVEAGLGLDAAMRKVCEEMGRTCPIISEEFSICNFQLQVGRPRREVLHDLGQRTGVDDMKSLAAILIQADRFGSSIAQALRTQSDAMRVRRRQLAEERAQKSAVKLIFPLVLFIFPAIFIVLVGPAGIQIAQNIDKF